MSKSEHIEMESEIYYSLIEDDWSNSDQSIEDVAQMFLDDLSAEEQKKSHTIKIYKGVRKTPEFSSFLSVNKLLENMSDAANEECGEWAEDYLSGVKESQKRELESQIISWASRNNIAPAWFMIENIEVVEFTIPENWS